MYDIVRRRFIAVPSANNNVQRMAATPWGMHTSIGSASVMRQQPLEQPQLGSTASRVSVSTAAAQPCLAPGRVEQSEDELPSHDELPPMHGSAFVPCGVGLASLSTPLRTTGYNRPLTAAMAPAYSMRR